MVRKKVLAISSGGGHWVQMLRLRPAFEMHDVTYACVRSGYADDVPGQRFSLIPDANRWDRIRLLRMIARVTYVVLKLHPDVILSTGAAPGYVAIRLGKLIGARTIWLDSIANARKLSLSGRKIGKYADLWLTQWEHLSELDGPQFKGTVL